MISTKHYDLIYVNLDVWLDTRLGTLAVVDNNLAFEVLQDKYHQRNIDEFPGLSAEAFKELYAKRDIETLKRSYPTGIVHVLNDLLKKVTLKGTEDLYSLGPKIVFNVSPYQLSMEEKEQIKYAVDNWLTIKCPIDIIDKELKDLHPAYFKKDFVALFFYEYNEWLNLHTKAFKEEKNRLPEISLFAPRIYFNAVPSKEEIDEIEKVMPLFKAHEWFAGQLVGLQLMDVKHFSLLER
jgi:hypothetical protein